MSFIMYKNIILFGVLLFLSNCNQHSNVNRYNFDSSNFTYQEKPFEIKWMIEKNSITYWLNLLQNLKCEENIFLTLNPYFKINESKILKKVKFTHPYFDQSALANQSKLKNLQNKRNILFCGSYFGYGFHEDGIKSSIEMLKNLHD